MSCTFGYMIAMIFIKWAINWHEMGDDIEPGTAKAPGIINIMIDMPLKMGSTSGRPLWPNAGAE